MTRALLTPFIGPVLVLAILSGCGKSDTPAPRFNEPLGGSYGTPMGVANIDPGITQDGASYKPAPFPGQSSGSADTTAAPSAGGVEADAIRTVTKDALTALTKLDVKTVLDAFIPDQVAELKKDPTSSSLGDTQSEFEKFIRVLRDKAPAATAGADPEAQAKLLDGLLSSAKIQVIGADNAKLTFEDSGAAPAPAGGPPTDPAAMIGHLKPMIAGLPGGGLQFKKVDKAWLIALPKPVTEKQSELVRAVSDFAREFMLKAEERLDAVTDKLDQTALQNLALAVMGDLAPQMQALQEKFRGVLEEAGAAPSETKPAENEPPKPDNPPPGPRTPGRGRRTP